MSERPETTPDIVDRLRGWDQCWPWPQAPFVVADAAAEIERLRAALAALVKAVPDIGDWMHGAMPSEQKHAYARALGNARDIAEGTNV
jgi:hypothetical protein